MKFLLFLFNATKMLFSSLHLFFFHFYYMDILYSELNKYLNNEKKEQDGIQSNKYIYCSTNYYKHQKKNTISLACSILIII